MSLDELRQMCDAPSDAFSAGAWCEAANKLLAICDDRAPLVEKLGVIEDFCEAHLPFASEKSEVVARRVLWAIRGSNDDPPAPDVWFCPDCYRTHGAEEPCA